MRRITLALPLALLLVAAACAPGRQTAPMSNAESSDLDPVGTFQYQMNVVDPAAGVNRMVTGQIRIAGGEGGYGGEITATDASALEITQVQVSNNQLTRQARSAEGPVTLRLAFNGQTFSGEWEEPNARRYALSGVRR